MGKSLLPHYVCFLECYYFITYVRILRNGRYVNVGVTESAVFEKVVGSLYSWHEEYFFLVI